MSPVPTTTERTLSTVTATTEQTVFKIPFQVNRNNNNNNNNIKQNTTNTTHATTTTTNFLYNNNIDEKKNKNSGKNFREVEKVKETTNKPTPQQQEGQKKSEMGKSMKNCETTSQRSDTTTTTATTTKPTTIMKKTNEIVKTQFVSTCDSANNNNNNNNKNNNNNNNESVNSINNVVDANKPPNDDEVEIKIENYDENIAIKTEMDPLAFNVNEDIKHNINQKPETTTTTTTANGDVSKIPAGNVVQQQQQQQRQQHQQGAGREEDEEQQSTDPNELIFARPKPVLLTTINTHIVCNLCYGYLIDATTIVECLHSFCHSCLIKHLQTEQYCPRCEMMINTAKPNIKSDTTLQAIVYKLVPGLYEKELMRKRAFYKDRPLEAAQATPEQRGDDTEYLIFSPSDYMSLSLEYANVGDQINITSNFNELLRPRYIQCPAKFTVAHMKKFVYSKFAIDPHLYAIDIMYKVKTIVLLDHYTLMDVAYIYTWKRDAPMRFFFSVSEMVRPIAKMVIKPITTKIEEVEEAVDAATTSTNSVMPNMHDRLMTVIHTPILPTTAPNGVAGTTTSPTKPNVVLPVIDIKVEDETESNVVASPRPAPPEIVKRFEIVSPRSSSELKSGSGDGKSPTDNLKITIISKPVKESKLNTSPSSDTDSPKTKSHKEKRVSFADTVEQTPKDERKVENIKLKIDLSKQNSVTIINMSDPNRKEIVKPVRVEKEWKVKNKKDKDKDKDNSNSTKSPSSSKSSSSSMSPLTVPPLTIKAKSSPKHSNSNVLNSQPVPAKLSPEEERKSQFLKSFALAPKTAVKDLQSGKQTPASFTASLPLTKPLALVKQAQKSPPKTNEKSSNVFTFKEPAPAAPRSYASVAASKRKSKEPIKAVAKRPKLSLATPPSMFIKKDDFKIRLPPKPTTTSTSTATTMSAASTTNTTLSTFVATSQPKKSNVSTTSSAATTTTTTTTATASGNANKLMPPPAALPLMRPPSTLPLKKATKTSHTTKSTQSNILTPHPTLPGVQIAPPGNRTPIAKRYQPILPKAARPNPFASLTSDANPLMKDTGTEIKSIANDPLSNVKIYGPKGAQGGNSLTTLMGPPPLPKSKPNSSAQVVHQQQQQRLLHSGLNVTTKVTSGTGVTAATTAANAAAAKLNAAAAANSYLNYALFNASKTKGNEVPPGCRTPMYAPSSPSYSPSSPQYVPNYTIPTVPQYKYTPKPSNESILHSILGSNNALSGLFPSPPVKKDTKSVPTTTQTQTQTSTTTPTVTTQQTTNSIPNKKTETQTQATIANAKRSYPFSRSPTSAEDPPEKQLKVKSLLTSCNINIPSSLSITITREDGESQLNNVTHPKHKNPVNNYIEILKLPDQPPVSVETKNKIQPPPNVTMAFNAMPPAYTMATITQKNGKLNGKNINNSTSPHLLMPPPKSTVSSALQAAINKPPTPPATSNNDNNKASLGNARTANQSNGHAGKANKAISMATATQNGNAKTVPPPKYSPQHEKLQTAAVSTPAMQLDKKTPSPEKRNTQSTTATTNSSSPASNESKSPKSPSTTAECTAAKKFRPILPRQEFVTIPEIVPPKVTSASVIGTYSSPSGVSVKVHGNKKTSPTKQRTPTAASSPITSMNWPLSKQAPSVEHRKQLLDVLKGGVPCTIASSKHLPQLKMTTASSPVAATKRPTMSTPPPTSTQTPTASTAMITLTSGITTPPTKIATSTTIAGTTPVVSVSNATQADITKMLKENIMLRAQVQAAAAANNPTANMIYSYANAAAAQMYGTSPMYSYQQAYIMEQLARMHANNEVFSEYMQKFGTTENGNQKATESSSSPTSTKKAAKDVTKMQTNKGK